MLDFKAITHYLKDFTTDVFISSLLRMKLQCVISLTTLNTAMNKIYLCMDFDVFVEGFEGEYDFGLPFAYPFRFRFINTNKTFLYSRRNPRI